MESDLTEDEARWLAVLGLLEVLQRFGTVKQPAGAKVIPFPAGYRAQTRFNPHGL